MNQWELVLDECEKALQGGYELLNFDNLTEESSATNSSSPEIIFSMGENQVSTSMSPIMLNFDRYSKPKGAYHASQSLIDEYTEAKDLRPSIFFIYPTKKHIPLCQKLKEDDSNVVSDRFLLRLPEVYLNQAEAYAQLDRTGESIASLQKLRATRFAEKDAGNITETGKKLVEFTRSERRRELCFEAHRWFDLRRYAVDSKYPESHPISHAYYEWDLTSASVALRGHYVLGTYPEDTGAYMLPIPDYAIIFNDGALVPNEERKDRTYNN